MYLAVVVRVWGMSCHLVDYGFAKLWSSRKEAPLPGRARSVEFAAIGMRSLNTRKWGEAAVRARG
jgi:hypothetical protein